MYELTVSADFENLAQVGELSTQVAKQAGFDDRGIYRFQMAVDEACTNVIEHAYKGQPSGDIRLVYDIQDRGIEVTIFDQGDCFDPTAVPDPNIEAELEDRQVRGLGIFFIRQLVDEVEYKFNTPHGNQLTLFKRLS